MARYFTARERRIFVQALATTYALVGGLPKDCREESNRRDMADLLRVLCGPDWRTAAQSARHVLSVAEWMGGKAPLPPEPWDDDPGT